MLLLQVPERQGQHGGIPRGAVRHGGGRSPLRPAASRRGVAEEPQSFQDRKHGITPHQSPSTKTFARSEG
jgi:hypothetical protein